MKIFKKEELEEMLEYNLINSIVLLTVSNRNTLIYLIQTKSGEYLEVEVYR